MDGVIGVNDAEKRYFVHVNSGCAMFPNIKRQCPESTMPILSLPTQIPALKALDLLFLYHIVVKPYNKLY